PRARAGACAGACDGPGAAEGARSPDGGQPVRPRRQGPRQRDGLSGAARRGAGVISRQKPLGWILIVVSAAYIAYFLAVRLLDVGPVVEKKELVPFIGSFVCLVLGTINVRMAALRERRRTGARE